jgi:23S rRNA (adenine2503-C2)-methyltransferase
MTLTPGWAATGLLAGGLAAGDAASKAAQARMSADCMITPPIHCSRARRADGIGPWDRSDPARDGAGRPLDAVVFAGMGEPLLNLGNVTKAIEKIRDRYGLSHFELATVGVVPRIYDLARYLKNSSIRLRLNVSLHAPTDDKRRYLIPYTKKHGIKDIITAAHDFAEATKTKARIRYMLIRNLNDSDEDADRLIELLEGRPLKLIISQYNDNNITGMTPTNPLDVLNFYNKIKESIDCDIFHNFGSAISGGCGQLRRDARSTLEQAL